MVVVQRNAELLEIIPALGTAGSLASGLNGRQQQRDEDADDRNHDQQLDQGKAGATWAPTRNSCHEKTPRN
jgi:hypothetical protein